MQKKSLVRSVFELKSQLRRGALATPLNNEENTPPRGCGDFNAPQLVILGHLCLVVSQPLTACCACVRKGVISEHLEGGKYY